MCKWMTDQRTADQRAASTCWELYITLPREHDDWYSVCTLLTWLRIPQPSLPRERGLPACRNRCRIEDGLDNVDIDIGEENVGLREIYEVL
jgi:hypothetical protein